MWHSEIVDLGTVSSKEIHSATFTFLDKIDKDFHFETSCGCINLNWDSMKGKLRVNVKFTSVPFHLQHQGYYLIEKKIKAIHGTNEDVLIIKAKVI